MLLHKGLASEGVDNAAHDQFSWPEVIAALKAPQAWLMTAIFCQCLLTPCTLPELILRQSPRRSHFVRRKHHFPRKYSC